jgi:ABC-type sugar transport system permease subunit
MSATSRISTSAAPWMFLAPFLLVFLTFTAYPLAQSFVLSGQQTFGPSATAWVGLDNFRHLIGDARFRTAVGNTIVFTVASVAIQMPLALGLALLLNRPAMRGRAAFRLAFFAPQLIGMVFVAMLAGVVFAKRTGLVNRLLHALAGFDLDFPWLQESIMLTLVVATAWMFIGFNMVYFLAALQNVSAELLEASRIDGAGPLSRFRHVTLPAISPVAGLVVLLCVVGSLQLFELPYLILAGGGSEDRGLTIVTYLFQNGFEQGDLGYASAIGWVLTVMLVVFSAAQFRLRRAVA